MYRAAFERSAVPSVVVDSAGRVVQVNEAYVEMSGRRRDELVGASSIDFIHADDLPAVIAGLDQLMKGARSVRHRRRHRRADGTWIPIEVSTCLLPHPTDDTDHLLLVQTLDHGDHAIDVDLDAEMLTRQLFQPAGDGACIHDTEGRVAFSSPSLDELVGRPAGWMVGRRLTDPELDPIRPDGEPADHDDDPAVAALQTGAEVSATLGIRTRAGARVWLAVVAGAVPREALPVRTSLRDITELVEAQAEARRLAAIVEAQLVYRANHDDLTGLTARRIVMSMLDEGLAEGRTMSVVFVDLDGFKAINDELGHVAGDDVLIGVADQLRQLAPPSLTVGRAGGDEFVAISDDGADAQLFVDRVRAAVARPEGLVPGAVRRVRASVGLAHSEPGDDRPALLTRADHAMYDAKLAGSSN